ncbi:hypothetical protein G9A89_022681 [Geosiphon pyriformis]|nr:hypothetical protein G9A89_022681 [Geosiphon pyriformis]
MSSYLSQELAAVLRFPIYWNRDPSKWGSVCDWDIFLIKQLPGVNKHAAHDSLAGELETLASRLQQENSAYKHVLAMKKGLEWGSAVGTVAIRVFRRHKHNPAAAGRATLSQMASCWFAGSGEVLLVRAAGTVVIRVFRRHKHNPAAAGRATLSQMASCWFAGSGEVLLVRAAALPCGCWSSDFVADGKLLVYRKWGSAVGTVVIRVFRRHKHNPAAAGRATLLQMASCWFAGSGEVLLVRAAALPCGCWSSDFVADGKLLVCQKWGSAVGTMAWIIGYIMAISHFIYNNCDKDPMNIPLWEEQSHTLETSAFRGRIELGNLETTTFTTRTASYLPQEEDSNKRKRKSRHDAEEEEDDDNEEEEEDYDDDDDDDSEEDVEEVRERSKSCELKPIPSSTPPLFSNHGLWAAFKLSFSGMELDEKWTLKSGRAVEDIMFAYGVKLKEEKHALVHSWIFDLSDTRLQGLFTKEEWEEVKTYNMPKILKVPKELAKHMVSYATVDVRVLRKKVLQSWLDPEVEYDPVKHGVFQYIHVVYERLCTWYEQNPCPLEERHLENWYNINLWSVIFDRCFEQLGVVVCIRGESCSIANSERKNETRTSSVRKKIGRRVDGIFRECNGRNEFGAIEVAKEFDGQTSTKWLKESFKISKVMHDMLIQLAGAVKNDPSRVRQLRTVGWLHFGPYGQMLEMDCANSRVCRLVRRKLHHVGQGLNRDEIAATLALLTAVLQSRYIIEEVYDIIKKPEDLNEESLLNIIDETGSSLESPKCTTLSLLPSMPTPKKKTMLHRIDGGVAKSK